MSKVSIIISAYNSENTIEKAINSCFEQTYSNIEIIVINDCSTDSTEQIIKNYAEKNSRLRLYSHEENKGCGHARKTGIAKATGDYICFLDSDDYIATDYIEQLLSLALENSADIVASGRYEVMPTGRKWPYKLSNTLVNKYLSIPVLNPLLIKSSLWELVSYSERRLYEDTCTLVKLLYYAQTIVTTDYIGYYHTISPSSVVLSADVAYRQISLSLACMECLEFLESQMLDIKSRSFKKYYRGLLEALPYENEYPTEVEKIKRYINKIKN